MTGEDTPRGTKGHMEQIRGVCRQKGETTKQTQRGGMGKRGGAKRATSQLVSRVAGRPSPVELARSTPGSQPTCLGGSQPASELASRLHSRGQPAQPRGSSQLQPGRQASQPTSQLCKGKGRGVVAENIIQDSQAAGRPRLGWPAGSTPGSQPARPGGQPADQHASRPAQPRGPASSTQGFQLAQPQGTGRPASQAAVQGKGGGRGREPYSILQASQAAGRPSPGWPGGSTPGSRPAWPGEPAGRPTSRPAWPGEPAGRTTSRPASSTRGFQPAPAQGASQPADQPAV